METKLLKDEVLYQITEEIEFFEEMQGNSIRKYHTTDQSFSYAISILSHMKRKIEKLKVYGN